MRYIEKRIEVSRGLAVLILLACVLISNFIPMLSFLMLASIIPAVYIGLKSRPANSVIVIVGLSLVTYALFGQEKSAYTMFLYVMPAILSAILYNTGVYLTHNFEFKHLIVKKDNQYLVYASIKLFLISIMIFMIGAIGYFVFVKFAQDVNILASLKDRIRDAAMNYSQVAGKYKVYNKETEHVLDIIVENSGTIVLAVYFVKALILAFISYFISIPLINKISGRRLCYNGFEMIMLPGKPAYIFIACICLSAISEYMDLQVITPDMISGFVVIMSILFFLEGLSLLVFIVKRWTRIKKNVNWFVIGFLLIFMGVILGVVALGVLDSISNYRKKWDQNFSVIGGSDERQ